MQSFYFDVVRTHSELITEFLNVGILKFTIKLVIWISVPDCGVNNCKIIWMTKTLPCFTYYVSWLSDIKSCSNFILLVTQTLRGCRINFTRFSNNSILHKTVNTNVMIGGPILWISELVNFQGFMNLVNSLNLITHFWSFWGTKEFDNLQIRQTLNIWITWGWPNFMKSWLYDNLCETWKVGCRE